MTGMQWSELIQGANNGSRCDFSMGEGLKGSKLQTFLDPDGTWAWEVSLYASAHEQWGHGYGCANESKAKHMAMHMVAALLQIMDGVRPHELE